MSDTDPHVAHLQRFPVKALDRQVRDALSFGVDGAVRGDRRWAIVDAPPEEPIDPDAAGAEAYVNGKKTDAVHRLRADVDVEAARIEIGVAGDQRRSFSLSEPGPLNEWLSAYVGRPVSVRRGDELGFPDRRRAPGPTVTATATLRTVGEWFDLPLPEVRRRFRANVEVGGVEPFWADRLGGEGAVELRLGDAVFEGRELCGRCVVPARDADSGAETPEFRRTFSRRRAETLPEWAPEAAFDHTYKLAATTAGRAAAGETVAVGDPVELG